MILKSNNKYRTFRNIIDTDTLPLCSMKCLYIYLSYHLHTVLDFMLKQFCFIRNSALMLMTFLVGSGVRGNIEQIVVIASLSVIT